VHHLSICAGIGGLDLGLKRAIPTLRTIAMVEREAFCIRHLATKMEEGALDPCPIYHDLLQFPWNKYRGLVDIISGGFPCQPFSVSGKQQSVNDERHLWPYIRQGVGELRPNVCFFENVDGISRAKSPCYHSVLHHVLSDLEDLGYTATAGCFTAEEVGAPHLRKRWFILGMADTLRSGLEEHGHSESDSTVEPSKMADPDSQRLEGRSQLAKQHTHQWPTGQGCPQGPDEPPRTVEPSVGRTANGIPSRVDRLRALGNSVVSQTAEKAYICLAKELHIESPG
jgi:DNA (cytosine-5)-methyltransferase 1